MVPPDREPCPACGGAGGGPFGRANSGWDIESYECLRCDGNGWVSARDEEERAALAASAPRTGIAKGIVKTQTPRAEPAKRRASGDDSN